MEKGAATGKPPLFFCTVRFISVKLMIRGKNWTLVPHPTLLADSRSQGLAGKANLRAYLIKPGSRPD